MYLKNNKFDKTALWKGIFCIPLIGCSTMAHALSYQTFLGLNYTNPAEMSRVKNVQFIAGGDEVFQDGSFRGTFNGVRGVSNSTPRDFLPNGRLALRINDKVVFGVDVTQPGYTDFQYPLDSFSRNAGLKTIIRTTDISPRLSWQAHEKLALGLGFNANYSYVGVLSRFLTPFGEFTNSSNPNWAYGMNAGLLYTVTKGTYFGFSYFSRISQRAASGNSTWGPNVSTRMFSSTLIIPATYTANLVQYVSPKWLFNGTVRYGVWDPQDSLSFFNTALPGGATTVQTQNFFNAFRYMIATKYDINDRWSALASYEYSPTSQDTRDRQIALPITTGSIIGIGAEAVITPGLKARVTFGQVLANPEIGINVPQISPASIQRADGNVKIRTQTAGFRLTYEN